MSCGKLPGNLPRIGCNYFQIKDLRECMDFRLRDSGKGRKVENSDVFAVRPLCATQL